MKLPFFFKKKKSIPINKFFPIIKSNIKEIAFSASNRTSRLKRLMDAKKIVRFLEAHRLTREGPSGVGSKNHHGEMFYLGEIQ